MAHDDLSGFSTAELEQKLRKGQVAQRTVLVIFGIILLAWIVLGYWRSNTPVFISTLAVAIGAGVAVGAGPRSIAQELQRRRRDSAS